MSLTAETKNWMLDYGLYCNRKYRSEMEQIFAFIDEAGKKLNRQIKDLDDIRIAMAALKEIREHQITVDFQVGPIEVKHHDVILNKMVLADSRDQPPYSTCTYVHTCFMDVDRMFSLVFSSICTNNELYLGSLSGFCLVLPHRSPMPCFINMS